MDVNSHKLNMSDYIAVANLHCKFINQGFLATLGVPFLALLYEAIDRDSESILIVERIDNKVIGFVTGTRGLGRVYKQLLLRPFRLIYSIKSSIFSPLKIFKIIEVILLSNKNKVLSDLPKHELLSIVVNPACQGGNHAENLFKALCIYFKEKNTSSFKIIVGKSLERAHSFYKKMDCLPIKEIQVHKGINSIVYVKECS